MFVDDNMNYLFTDMPIAQGNISEWSYPNWPSHLDHILITDGLFNEINTLMSREEYEKFAKESTN